MDKEKHTREKVSNWLNGNKVGIDIFFKKYRLDNEDFDEWLHRVSGGNEYLQQAILDKRVALGGRILANRGTERTTSNCFILPPPKDSIAGIMDQCTKMALTYKQGGGCGFDVSTLRPIGAKITGQEQPHKGLEEFAPLFSAVTGAISGKGRRGALSMIIDADHPNVIQFINLKKDKHNGVEKANLSVKLSDDFMKKAITGEKENKKYKVESTGEEIEYTVDYKFILNEIVEKSRVSAEPGIVFWDNANNNTLCSGYKEYDIVGLNPCMEVSGIAWDACLLGSINLSEYINFDRSKNKYGFDMDLFVIDVAMMVRELNKVQHESIETLPLPEQRETARKTRQIGLGFMGLATLYMKLGIEYGSDEGNQLLADITSNMLIYAVRESAFLVKEYGTFEGFDIKKTKASPMWNLLDSSTQHIVEKYGLANLKLLSVAPTGSISTMYGVSSGIEPEFAISYIRNTESLHDGKTESYKVFIPIVDQYMKDNKCTEDKLPKYLTTVSHNISPMARINVQATAQEYIDNSISSTVNLPKGTTNEEIYKLYLYAWDIGLKGLTIYVDGTLDSQILVTDNPKKEDVKENIPKQYNGIVYIKREINIGCGIIRAFVGWNIKEQKIHDYYTEISEQGGCGSNIKAQAISNSLLIKSGQYTLQELLEKQNRVMACPSFSAKRGAGKSLSKGKNCGTAILHELIKCEKEFKDKFNYHTDAKDRYELLSQDINHSVQSESINKTDDPQINCPHCGELMNIKGHCFQCDTCGYTVCD